MTDSGRRARARNWIVASLWFALAAASIHLLDVLYDRHLRHELTWTGREFLWMAPVSYMIVFAVVGSLGAIIAYRRPDFGRPAVVVGVFLTIVLFGAFFLLLPRIHPLASAALAVGIAVEVGRRIPRDTPQMLPLVHLAVLPAIGIGLFGAGEQVTRQWREERTIAALNPQPGAPDVIVIVLDAVRADNLSAYGYRDPTSPTLERLAHEGVLFERAFATAPWSLPSHASILTGLLPSEMYADWKTPFSRKVPTLAEVLRNHGWATGMFSANASYLTQETGLARGFVHLDDYALAARELVRCNILYQALIGSAARLRGTPWMFNEHQRRDARELVDRFLNWQQAVGEQPFFAFLNLFDAHEQPLVSDSMKGRFARSSKSSEETAYDAGIAQMDEEIGRLVDTLARRGVLDRTLLIVTSDHGQLLGEHGLMYHGTSLYRRVLQVPLVLRFPRHIPAGTRVRQVASLQDLSGTILDLLSLQGTRSPNGSFARLWTDTAEKGRAGETVAVAQASRLARGLVGPANDGTLDALIGDRWYYIEGPGSRRELFDYTSDTAESVNLANDSTYRDTLAILSQELRRLAPRAAPLGSRAGPFP